MPKGDKAGPPHEAGQSLTIRADEAEPNDRFPPGSATNDPMRTLG